MRGETFKNCGFLHRPLFQSTPLMRGETCAPPAKRLLPADFNPLPSCEGRPATIKQCIQQKRFQSTPLMRGETIFILNTSLSFDISIHSPHARGDASGWPCVALHRDFNPLPSCEGRRKAFDAAFIACIISIHSPHARGDYPPAAPPCLLGYFNPLPSCEGRQNRIIASINSAIFQSTPLMRGETA